MLQTLLDDGFQVTPEVEKAPAYVSSQIVVFRAGAAIAQPASLDSVYQFVLAGDEGFPVLIGGKEPMVLEPGCLMPVNPGQVHSAAENRLVREYLPVFINKQFMAEVAYQVCGKRQVHFANSNRRVPESTKWLVQDFMEHAATGEDAPQLACLNYELAFNLMRIAGLPEQYFPSSRDKKLIGVIDSYMRESYSHQVSLEELAQLVNYSPYHLIKVFKQATGKTPMAHLMSVRIERAQQLLRKSDSPISVISEQCGFNSLSHFCATFKRETGYSPSAYRKGL